VGQVQVHTLSYSEIQDFIHSCATAAYVFSNRDLQFITSALAAVLVIPLMFSLSVEHPV